MSLRKSLLPSLQGNASDETRSTSAFPADNAHPPASREAFDRVMERSSVDLTFTPTEAQARVKSRFWTRRGPFMPGDVPPTLAEIKQLTNSSAVDNWIKQPGFLDWFMNSDYAEEKIKHLADLSLKALEDLILNTDQKSQGARVAAIKLVAEMSKTLLKGSNGAADAQKDKVDTMSKEDLIKLLQSSGIDVITQVTIPSSSKD